MSLNSLHGKERRREKELRGWWGEEEFDGRKISFQSVTKIEKLLLSFLSDGKN
jgi:hypothetical protein